MKLLFDLFPVILFFISFKYAEQHQQQAADWLASFMGSVTPVQAPILLATAVVILATLLQIGWVYLRHGKVDRMLWISLGLVTVFGSMTLLFRDDTFIKWKPTVLYWIMSGSMLTATLFQRNAVRLMLKDKIELPEVAWSRLNLAWIIFFLAMGGLNLFVAFHYSTDTWVNFKLFGGMGLLLLFVLAQGAYLSRYVKEEETP